ncbi:MAG: hypothetical protein WBP82_03725 [Leuconostoc mesenteroides]
MTEPTAYIYEDHVFNTEKEAVLFKKEFDRYKHDDMLRHVILPLFTADEISDIYRQNNRVKMTKKQHKQFGNYKTNKNDFYDFWQSLLVDDVSLFKEISERNLMLAWLDDRTIEVVPDMKWFVRSKEKYQGFYMLLGNLNELRDPWIFTKQDNFTSFATEFDTKEEAEKWTNPLTEAVQSPVERE